MSGHFRRRRWWASARYPKPVVKNRPHSSVYMSDIAPIALHNPKDFIGIDGGEAARLVHFGNDYVLDRRHKALSSFAQECMTAFVEYAVHGASRDLRYFTPDFGSERISDTGWCGSESHFSLSDVSALLTRADEIRVSCDWHDNVYTAKTFSRRFLVRKSNYPRALDLMEEIVLGEIALTTETKLQGGDRRLRSYRIAKQKLWFWQQRRMASPVFESIAGEVPAEWRSGRSIPDGYLELPFLD